MSQDRLFLDTVFIQAILNPRDQYHSPALQLFPRVKNAREVWITKAIFMEVGNALSTYDRHKVAGFIQKCYETNNISIVNITPQLFKKGLNLYESRADKTWGLVDCFSFIVMEEQNLIDAVTSDIHFIQAGFRALLR
ncbi:type II toxin-antitoxin system VapC family toxin [Oscillatoria acuminata]|uniref:Putative nucleic acid-binding protein, contains PIN domain n=1 Tax=Oscillatoria acuminata PCC 6304 TaxID=56110 RepID=K9THM5_9CYAN|nr:type II toxin-antitoxin system VapC family toxin [Oscillatoria acuminata]AFY81529.1 putative nucleic acid-binding protein, contains PIN domain [Oscillatoria acuminata PCC 6304]